MDDNNNDNKDTKSIERLEKETIKEWNEYYNDIDNRIKNMWNFVLYNQFNNEEMKRLHSKIKFLEDDLKYFEEKIENLKCTNKNLNYDLDNKNYELSVLKKKWKKKKSLKLQLKKVKKGKEK